MTRQYKANRAPPDGWVSVECANCGKHFQKKASQARYHQRHFCNRACRGKWQTRQATVSYSCDWCGGIFEGLKCRVRRQHIFCSVRCYGEWQAANRIGENAANWRGGPVELTCAMCGKRFQRPRCWHPTYCSRECRGIKLRKIFSGSGNPAWQGGITKLRRSRHHQRSWPRFVKERAAYRCELCGSTDRVCAHHITHYATDPSMANDPNNGICLCFICHRAAHSGHIVLLASVTGGLIR